MKVLLLASQCFLWFRSHDGLSRQLLAASALVPLLLQVILAQQAKADDCPRSYSLSIPEAAVQSHRNKNKLIIAHRGASFHLPEHTLAAYRLGLEIGADFIEPDLVATQDGHLIAIHTADLNVTTNVAEVFSNRDPWFSPFMNRSGYWSYNFTLEEIKTLRVNQRLPRARTTAYDGMFPVPTFLEIQQLLNEWNDERMPEILLHTEENDDDNMTIPATTTTTPLHHHYPQTAGIYAELKASPWFAADANIILVDLLLDMMTSNADLFAKALECPALPKYDEYIVPPLVVQSFEGDVLEDLDDKWRNHPEIKGVSPPPMILLSNKQNCWEEPFWFEVGERWRKVIHGIGMAKECFPKIGEEGRNAFDRAEEFNLLIHPYTERPEHEFLLPGFQDGFEETQYLLCTVGVQGVFSESVHTAIMAARMECPTAGAHGSQEGTQEKITAENEDDGSQTSPTTAATNGQFCWEDTSEASLYIGLASFVMGIFITLVLSIWLNRGCSFQARPPRQQRVPVQDADGVVLDQQDDEML